MSFGGSQSWVLSWSISKNWLSTLLFAKAGGERLSQKRFLPREGGWIMSHWEVSKSQMLGKVSGKSGWNIPSWMDRHFCRLPLLNCQDLGAPVRSTCNSPKCLRATCTTFGLSKVWTQFENECKQLGHLLQFFRAEENHVILEFAPTYHVWPPSCAYRRSSNHQKVVVIPEAMLRPSAVQWFLFTAGEVFTDPLGHWAGDRCIMMICPKETKQKNIGFMRLVQYVYLKLIVASHGKWWYMQVKIPYMDPMGNIFW